MVKIEISQANLGLLLFAASKGISQLPGIEKEGLHVLYAKIKLQAERQGIDTNKLINDIYKSLQK